MENFKSAFYCYVHQLTDQNTEADFQLFYCSIFDAPFCYLVE